jgi:hypothetical protein
MLLGATGTLTALLASVGIANGDLSNMFRNHGHLALSAFLLAIGAVVCGAFLAYRESDAKKERDFLIAGIGMFAASMAAGLLAATLTWQDQPQPTLRTSVNQDGTTTSLTLGVSGTRVRANQHIMVRVWPISERGTDSVQAGPAIYEASIGPNQNGDADFEGKMDLPTGNYDAILAKAWIKGESSDCSKSGTSNACLTIAIKRPPMRPRLAYTWDTIGTASQPLLTLDVSARDEAPESSAVHVGLYNASGRRHVRLAGAWIAPDDHGDFAGTLRTPIPQSIHRVCAIAVKITSPSTADLRHLPVRCAPGTTGLTWQLITVPSIQYGATPPATNP